MGWRTERERETTSKFMILTVAIVSGQNKERRFVRNEKSKYMAFADPLHSAIKIRFLTCIPHNNTLLLNKIQDDDEVGSERLGKSIVRIMFWAYGFFWAALMERKPERL